MLNIKKTKPSIANCGCFTILFPFFVHRSLLIVKGKLKEKKRCRKVIFKIMLYSKCGRKVCLMSATNFKKTIKNNTNCKCVYKKTDESRFYGKEFLLNRVTA